MNCAIIYGNIIKRETNINMVASQVLTYYLYINKSSRFKLQIVFQAFVTYYFDINNMGDKVSCLVIINLILNVFKL